MANKTDNKSVKTTASNEAKTQGVPQKDAGGHRVSSDQKKHSNPTMSKPGDQQSSAQPQPKKKHNLADYVDLIETVARVEYSRLPNHLIDYSELVNIGAIALHTLFTSNPDREYNVTYLSTAIKWAIRNELRYRYKWYTHKKEQKPDPDDEEMSKNSAREAVYETILSMEGMMEGDNPHELKDDSTTPEEDSEFSELARVIRECIGKLPEREKLIVEARFFKNMKMREIGVHFNISPSRASRIVQSGLDKVKHELIKRGYAEGTI